MKTVTKKVIVALLIILSLFMALSVVYMARFTIKAAYNSVLPPAEITSVDLTEDEKGLVKLDNPYVEYLTATDMDGKKLYVILMNNSTVCQAYSVESCGKTCSGSIPALGMEVKTMKIK